MDWNRIEGNWKQFKGQAKEKWGRLTDNDLDVINGRQDPLEGKIQERYGLAGGDHSAGFDFLEQQPGATSCVGSWMSSEIGANHGREARNAG
jgi:uncharacterized protein YjbJ (UPF0337 family)